MMRTQLTVQIFVLVTILVTTSLCQPQLGISPAEVVLTTSTPANTVLTCSISSGISINTIYNLQILRQRDGIDSALDPLCEATSSGTGFVSNAPSDIEERGTVSGGLDTNTYTASTLVLTLATADVECNDKGTYQCKLVYQDSSSNIITLVSNSTLSVYAIPSDVTMTVRKNGNIVQGTVDNQADFNVGQVADFSCTASIGSDNTTRIQWKRTSEFGTAETFLTYNPPQGTYSDGTASSSTTGCSYSRTATMSYNVTSADANRDNNLVFQCLVSVVAPNSQKYTTQNPPSFYINPASSDSGGSTGTSTGDSATADVGPIVGGIMGGLVLIVIIVLLVYFLWYRRRDDGETYRTKEETGGSNPNLVDTYATVNEEKRNPNHSRGHKPGYENDGMDEEQTGRHYMNHHDFNDTGRYGRSNRAMDDDDYDGAPTINHMGMDPSTGGYGTGV